MILSLKVNDTDDVPVITEGSRLLGMRDRVVGKKVPYLSKDTS